MIREAGVVFLLLLGVLLVAPTGSPLHIGYAKSDSMAPTIDPGDGYVVIDTDRVQEGDIIVFWSAPKNEYATHRVVERTPDGFITKGDNNPVTDQATGHPPVPRSAIVGEVLTLGGRPLTIPGLGAAIAVVRAFRAVLLAVLLLLVAFVFVRERKRSSSSGRGGRQIYRVKDVIRPLFIVGIVTTIAVTPIGASTFQLTYIATATDSPDDRTVPVGERVTREVSFSVADMPLTQYVIRADGMRILDAGREGATITLTVSIPPPEAAGPQRMQVHFYPYPAVLPADVLGALHDVHPIVAVLASTLAIFLPLYLVYLILLDGAKPLALSRSRWFHWLRGD